MNLFLRLVVYILIGLIRIGDSVLFFASIPLSVGKNLYLIVRYSVKILLSVWKNGFFKLKQQHFKKPIFGRKKERILLVAKKSKKGKLVPAFPIPFFTKLRYVFIGIFFSLLFIFIPLVVFIFIQDIPSPKELTFRQIPQTTKIYDRNGILLYEIFATQNRTLVELKNIPPTLRQATISIEDKEFYKHPGFDLIAIARATYSNLSGKDIQGGSTITQQLIKSSLLSSEKTLLRKIKEVIIAFLAEKIYTKDQILEMYFNQVPYGGTAWGVEAAADKYFGKPVKDLDLAESAFLAGMPGAPTLYSPYGINNTIWKKRQTDVLSRMSGLGYISQKQEKQALEQELHFVNQSAPLRAPHFVMYIKDVLVKKYGISAVERGGLSVTTSLDLNLQEIAQKIVTTEVENDSLLNLTNGAALVTNPQNGDILAMIGSQDFNEENGGNVNVTTALRQPGSSIKVVTYAAALSKGYTPATILDDSPITFTNPYGQSYSPVNYDGRFHGKVSLRLALGNSFNIPAVRTINQIGIPEMVNLAKKMGIKTWGHPNRYGVSITLGSAEVTMVDMATVYGVMANQGIRVDVNPILRVTDYKGSILEEKSADYWYTQAGPAEKGERVLDSGVAFILSDILADNGARTLEFGSASPLFIPGHYLSVKTGTSDNKRDNWTIGYTPKRLVAVWVGNNDGSPMSPSLASGITGAAPIWNKIMTHLLQSSPSEKPKIPNDVVSKKCLGRTEYFIKGTQNSVNCTPIVTPTPNPIP